MNILFIYPKYPETFWSFEHVLKFISRKAAFPPLGLMTVSSMLPKGINRKLLDLNVDNLNDKDIMWADYIFVSAMIVQKDSVKDVVKRAKEHKKTVVAGGPLFSQDNISEFPEIDHFVLNEGEITFPMFLDDLINNKNVLKKTYSSDKKPDLSLSPVPDWNLIRKKNYATMLVQFSRGCPYDCEFCDITLLNGRIPRTKSPSQMIRELNSLHRAGWRGSVFVVDDNFIGHKKKVKEVLRSIIQWQKSKNYPFSFLTEASLELSDDQELMTLMADANFKTVFLGLETPSKESLAECNKFQNTQRDLVDSVKILQQNGFQVQGGFIVGFDSDNHSIFERQIEFIQTIGVVTAMVGLLNAIPGTKLYRRLKKEGRIITDSNGNNTDGTLNFIPKMDPKILKEGYKKILKTIYSPKKYYERILRFLENYNPKQISRGLNLNEIKAFLLSIWKLGIIDKERKYYWKLLFKSIFRYPKAFPEVVTFTIYGFHFKRVAANI